MQLNEEKTRGKKLNVPIGDDFQRRAALPSSEATTSGVAGCNNGAVGEYEEIIDSLMRQISEQNSLTKFIRGKLEVIQFKHALYISTADSALTQLMSHHESILQINSLLLNSFTITQQRSVNQRNVVCGSAKLNFPRLPGFTACKIFHHQI